jgi:hypothetical protein
VGNNDRTKKAFKVLGSIVSKKLLVWVIGTIGGSTILFFLLIVIVAGVIANVASSFWFHMFTGFDPKMTVNETKKESANVEQVFKDVAAEWSNGLDAQQQQIVQQLQLDMPYSTLLALGKYRNNFQSKDLKKDAQSYYDDLAPHYTWVKAEGKTITRHPETSKGPHGETITKCVETTTTFTVWELVSADVWNGTFTASYKTQTTGGFNGCSGSQTIQPVMDSYEMKYDHKRFRDAEYKYKILKQQTDQDDPLPYEIMYTLQPDIYDPLIQGWSSLYGKDPISADTHGGYSGPGSIGPTPKVSVDYLKYVPVDAQKALDLINSWGTRSFFSVQDIQAIIDAAKQFNLNPLLLLAITGQEQDFDSINAYGGNVSGNLADLKMIEANPFNLYGYWSVYHPGVNPDGSGTPDLAHSAIIAARTVASHLTVPPPAGMDAILYINSTSNPTHEIYAQDVNWGYGVKTFFWKLSNGLGIKYPGVN